ncbi:hypothetical protein DENSPDRAFT_663322 [Dentipellis sp. KUC8613]|nr:hypothetical protein DENSPDRAFT_663322 [Dentipellis sp. KUC8613]
MGPPPATLFLPTTSTLQCPSITDSRPRTIDRDAGFIVNGVTDVCGVDYASEAMGGLKERVCWYTDHYYHTTHNHDSSAIRRV